jgi:tryptophanyl-tRNA synthetase
MQRMTQYRDKSGKLSSRDIAFQAMNELRHELADNYWEDDNIEDKINARINKISGSQKSSDSVVLFNYPVLMASDILLYNATYIPVGEDQTQHLEFTRDIAERLNNKFSQELFIVPESVKKQHEFFGKDQGLRIKDLQDPTKKMSKSDDSGKGVIFLGDAPELASKKIMGAATDSIGSINLDWENQPGISNLLQILSLFKNKNITEIESEWKGNTSYGELKKAVSEEVESFLNNLQEKLKNIDDDEIINKLESSEKLMNEVANATLNKVQKAVGLR